MRTENYYTANDDLRFYYERVIDWNRLAPLYGQEPESAASWCEVLEVAGDYIGKQVARRAAEVDRLGTPHTGEITVSEPMAENLRGLAELGLIGLGIPRAYGGEGFPFAVQAAVFEMLARADSAAMVQYAFYTSPAAMILRFGSEDQKRAWVPRLARGEVIGWVAMTEPEAGSDVGNISTTATRQTDGSWRINGRKQFISSGNGGVGVLLARCVPGSQGLNGLGLFIVPRCVPDRASGFGYRASEGLPTPDTRDPTPNYVIERAEEKVCISGSPTCSLSFNESQAQIMGAPGDGWRQITTFMNEARLAVAIQACGVAQASLVAAGDYAAQRVQMGKPIREHPLVAEMLLDMHTTVAGLRALWMEAAVAYDLVQHVDGARKQRLERYLRELTPLVKYYGAEEAIRVARMGMQVFGGYGVIKDYEVERFLRDSLILPIYEGTSQIQALMATKDLLKAALRRPQALLVPGGTSMWLARTRGRLYRQALRDFSRAVGWLLLDLARQLGPRRTAQLLRGGAELEDRDLGYVLLSAERLTQMLAHLHIGRLLIEQARRWPERRPLAERFVRRTADVCQLNARRIMRGERDALKAIDQWRAG